VEYFLTVKLPSWVKLQRMLFTTWLLLCIYFA
jgi:hypothetical protein